MKNDEFLIWLKLQANRDDAIGDLANDFILDDKLQPISSTQDLASRTQSDSLEALKRAWNMFCDEPYPFDHELYEVDVLLAEKFKNKFRGGFK